MSVNLANDCLGHETNHARQLDSPKNQNAVQTLGFAPFKMALNRSRNLAHDESGVPGRGNSMLGSVVSASDSGIPQVWR